MNHPQPCQCGTARQFFGKYRGKVLENIDPLFQGRIMAEVAAVSGSMLNWAMPCVPYAGPQVGFYAIPPIGANVWIEYEGGDPNYPIWTGCFWGVGEVPLGPDGPPEPALKIFKTEFITLFLNDLPEVGGFTLECIPPSVTTPLRMVFNSTGVEIDAPPAIVKMVPEEGITLEFPEATISMTAESIEIAVPESTFTQTAATTTIVATDVSVTATAAIEISAAADVAIEAGAAAEVSAGADVSIEAGGACEVSGGGDVSLEAGGAVETTAGGAVAITAGGACALTATDLALTAAATEITSAGIVMTGIAEVNGDLLIDGQQPLVI